MSELTFYRLSAFVDLTDRERDAMYDMVGPERPFAAAERIRIEGKKTMADTAGAVAHLC